MRRCEKGVAMEGQAFSGFPQDAFQFLKDLAANNNKAWFEDNKARFKKSLQNPAVDLIATLGPRLQSISPGIRYDTRTNGSGSLMRIYRDTRFSKDKTPYKTAIATAFWEGEKKKMACPGFGFHMEADSMDIIGGLWHFVDDSLGKYREAVADEKLGPELEEILKEIEAVGEYRVSGEMYKTVPRGYEKEHPRAELLKRKGLYAHGPKIGLDVLQSADLVEVLFTHFSQMAALQQWQVRAGL
jgi:uncharacterized protein (TIGR02453 family)